MNTKLILIFSFTILYGAFEVYLNLRQSRKSTISNSDDKGSLRLLYLLITVGYFLSFTTASQKLGRIYHWDTCFATGAVLAFIGLFIRIKSILTLKQFFTYSVAKVQHHQLVTTGFYGYIRHPGYLGQLIIFLGIAVSLSNWLSIFCMMVPVLTGFLYRIGVEERFMSAQMGSDYTEYQNKTKKLLPGIY
jgi:protein-S-isoprenylcysteine O-methyltransferase Ste14